MRDFGKIEIKSTKNYKMFKTLEQNRAVTEGRAKKILKSIDKVGYIPSPIIVNENMEVIDGQGRLEALKIRRLPVYYIELKGIGIDECISMNIYQTNWGLKDYINSYAKSGNENYIKLLELLEKYEKLGFYNILAMAQGNDNVRPDSDVFKNGSFEFNEKTYIECMDRINYILDIYNENPKILALPYINVLIGSINQCRNFEEIDKKILKEKLVNYLDVLPTYNNATNCMESLEFIYNYHSRQEYVSISALYRKKIIELKRKSNARRKRKSREKQEGEKDE